MDIQMRAIGFVGGARQQATRDHWGDNRCDAVLDETRFAPDVPA